MTQGVRVKRVGCFKEDPAKRSINTLLFSDLKSIRSTAKVDFKNFGRYTQGLISRCGAAAAAKSFLFFAINNIGKHTTERTLIFEIGCRFKLTDSANPGYKIFTPQSNLPFYNGLSGLSLHGAAQAIFV